MRHTFFRQIGMWCAVLCAFFGVILVLVFGFESGHIVSPKAIFTRPVSALVAFPNSSFIAEVAADTQSRTLGLSGRDAVLGGLLLVFPEDDYHGIWMRGMRFPIDIIWIRKGEVVDVRSRVPVSDTRVEKDIPIYTPRVPAEYALEVPAGYAETNGVRVGDRVGIRFGDRKKLEALLAAPADDAPKDWPGERYAIETLREELPQGSDFRVIRERARTDAYRTYDIAYRSGELTISGVMNVPSGDAPPDGFPILILNHGLIDPKIYTTGRGAKREQDYFARAGYATIHPDYRGHAASSPNPDSRHDFYVGYTLDVIAAIDAIKKSPPDRLDATRIGMWGHSMGGGMAARVMVLRPDVRAFVLFAPISADAFENFYELDAEEVAWLKREYGDGDVLYRRISPMTYFEDVRAPVQLHHGTADKDVPIKFSRDMYGTLKKFDKIVELYEYDGEKHEFIPEWDTAIGRSVKFFDRYVKEGGSPADN